MCQKCGCNTCETESTMLVLNESKAPATILSEGLKHHIDNNKPLTEHLYRAGSRAYFDLIAEARSLYSRGILEFTNEDDLGLLTETDLGHFGMFEGKKVPLDFPIELNEEMDLEDELANMEFGMDYDQLGSGEKEWVRDEMDNMSINESDSKYPNFDLNKNIKYQDTSISSGMWRYTGTEQGGKGVYRNLNNGQILAFDRSDFDIFRKNLSSHFDFSESLNEDKGKMPTQDQVDKFFTLTQNEMHYLNSKPVAGQEKTFNNTEIEPWDGYDLSNFNSLVRKAKSKGKINENKDEMLDLVSHRLFDKDYKQLKGEERDKAEKEAKMHNLIKEVVEEAKKKKAKKKDNRPIGKPMRSSSGGKAYKVYVKDPKTKKVKTVRFGSGGLRAKINDSKARAAFAARHKCSSKKDRTKAGYWSCRLPRYAKLLGLKSSFSGFW